jgi:hypothetical protein
MLRNLLGIQFSIPSASSLNAAKLQAYLGLDVVQLEVEPIGQGEGMLSDMLRLKVAGPKLPASRLIAKFTPHGFKPRLLGRLFSMFRTEVAFYNSSMPSELGFVPECYTASHCPRSDRYFLLMEDLGMKPVDQLAGLSFEQAKQAVCAIAKMHAKYWNCVRSTVPFKINLLDDKAFLSLVQHSFSKALPKFFRASKSRGVNIPRRVEACLQEYARRMGEISKAQAPVEVGGELHTTLCHADFRADNIFFTPAFKCIDFQLISERCAESDIAYLLTQSMATDMRRQHEVDLLLAYHAALVEGGVQQYPLEQCLHSFQRCIFPAMITPVMAIGDLEGADERIDALFTCMTTRGCAALADWGCDTYLDTMCAKLDQGRGVSFSESEIRAHLPNKFPTGTLHTSEDMGSGQ